jgi:hypothetical protein
MPTFRSPHWRRPARSTIFEAAGGHTKEIVADIADLKRRHQFRSMNCSPKRMGGAKGIFQTSLDALRRCTVADVLATFVRFAEGAGLAVTRCDPSATRRVTTSA